MSTEAKVYSLLSTIGTFPVSPVYQVQTITPPSVIYDMDAELPQAKRGQTKDDVNLTVLFYSVEFNTGLEEAKLFSDALFNTCNEDFTVIRYISQQTSWAEPNYVIVQRYRLKLK